MRAVVATIVLLASCVVPAVARTPQQEREMLHAQALQLKAVAWEQWWEVGRMTRQLGAIALAMARARVRLKALATRISALGAELEALQDNCKALEAKLKEARARAAQRLKVLYLHGLSLPQVIMARAGAGEILAVGYSLRLVVEADRKRLEHLVRRHKELEELKAGLLARAKALREAVEELSAELKELVRMAATRQRLLSATARRISRLMETVRALAKAEGRLVRTFGLGPAAGLGVAAVVVPGAVVVGRPGKGVVVAAPQGQPVMSPWEGVVSFAGALPGWAKVVVVDHRGRVHTVVGGLERILVRPGQRVAPGQRLGVVGASRRVYLELRVGTRVLEVERWLGLGG